jgi:hypothetical protein
MTPPTNPQPEEEVVWKQIEGSEFMISSRGDVVGRKGLPIKRFKTQGYWRLNVFQYGRYRRLYLHRLMALAFLPNPKNLPQINHIDGDKENYSIDNLEWCDQSHNIRHAYDMGLKVGIKGSKNGRAKLTESLVISIRKRRKMGVMAKDLAAELGVDITTICRATSGKRFWKSVPVVKEQS